MEQNEQQNPFTAWAKEMGRRHVFRVLAIYIAAGWGLTEIVQGVVGQIGAPQAISTFVTIAFIVGLPIALFLAWMFDVDKDGVHRVPTRGKGQFIITLAITVLLAGSYGVYRYLPRGEVETVYQPPDDIVMAVLPFRNLSPNDDFGYLGQAIAEDLLNGIAVIPDLSVKATFSSFSLAEQGHEVFAEQLGVNRLLDGTYREEDGNLRISARLVDTETGDVVWTRVLTDSVSNIFMIQDQIAKDIASELGLPHPTARRDTSRQVDPQVYQLYLQAREGYRNPWQDTENTMKKIQQVLELEPNFPEALMMMGFLHTGFAWTMEARQSPWVKTGEEYTIRALEIDPDLSEAYAVLALNKALQYRWQEAREYADRAIEIAGPRPLNVVYTLPYNNLGHKSRTIDILLRVFDEDPLNPQTTRNLISVYADLGEDEKALQWEQLAIQRGIRYQRHYLIPVYARKGDMETAQQLASLWGEEHGFEAGMGEHILDAYVNGRSDVFIAATKQKVDSGDLPMGQAIWNFMGAGADADLIFQWVREAIPKGKFNQITLMTPRAAQYRQDSRWREIYTDLGLIEYWKSVQLPDFCASESITGLCD